MKIAKRIGLTVVSLLLVALYFPGLPVGAAVQFDRVKNLGFLTCRYLHWSGLRVVQIELAPSPGGGVVATDTTCYYWANWKPKS